MGRDGRTVGVKHHALFAPKSDEAYHGALPVPDFGLWALDFSRNMR